MSTKLPEKTFVGYELPVRLKTTLAELSEGGYLVVKFEVPSNHPSLQEFVASLRQALGDLLEKGQTKEKKVVVYKRGAIEPNKEEQVIAILAAPEELEVEMS